MSRYPSGLKPARASLLRQGLAVGCGLVLLTLFSDGCVGYHLGPAKPAFLKDIHTIAIPAFRNDTLIPRLEGLVTDTVIKQFQQDGTYQIANSDSADAILRGSIERVTRTPERSVTGNVLLTNEFDIDLLVRYQLVERSTGKILDNGRVDGVTNFFVGDDVQQDEQQAMPLAAEQLAVHLVSALSEGF
jgi:hypothetical protein